MMKTSSRIALQFTVFTAVSTLLILMCINISFFLIWHGNDRDQLTSMAIEQNNVQAFQIALQQSNKRFIMPMGIAVHGGQTRPISTTVFYPAGPQENVVNYSRKLVDIIHANDNRWYMVYNERGGRIMLLDISENVQRQIDLGWLSVIILVVMIFLSYRISRWFVSRGLRDLYRLSEGVKDANIDTLHKKLTMDHLPQEDEINIVAGAIDSMKQRIHHQIQSIKDFVAHVSHEFKTPLMVMRSDIDLAKKTKEYDELMEKNTLTVQQMQTLLDGLLVLTVAQTGKMQTTEVNMSTLLERTLENMEKKYDDKDIIIEKNIASPIFLTTHEGAAESILSNILDNAYKYTPEGGNIAVTLTDTSCIIADTGIGIADEHRENIRQPFRQADKNRQDGVGLGLSIVQKLSEVLGWKVRIEKNGEQGTKVVFLFSKDF